MDKNKLIEIAGKITPPGDLTAKEYGEKIEFFVATINDLMLKRDDIDQLIGHDNIQMMKDNHMNHAKFIESILLNFDPHNLTETVLWVFRAYRSRGFQDCYWSAQLNLWIQTLQDQLSEQSYNEIKPIYTWMQVNIPHFVNIANADLDKIK